MKPLLSLVLLLMLNGCSDKQIKERNRNFYLNIHNGHGWSAGGSTMTCDSFQMITTKIADVWVDGKKIHIEAEDVIYPSSNQ